MRAQKRSECMINIQNAVLHLFDIASNTLLVSERPLELSDSAIQFLTSHIEKHITKQTAKQGTFHTDSEFLDLLGKYNSNELDFLSLSKEIAQKWSYLLKQTAEQPASDFFICEFSTNEVPFLAIFRTTNKFQFTHQVLYDESGKLQTSIVRNNDFLPQPNQSIDEFAFINLQTMAITISAKKFSLDGNTIQLFSEALLECTSTPSPKETIHTLEKTAEKVAESFNRNAIHATNAVKTAIAEELETKDTLNPVDTAAAVFPDQPALQQAFQEELRKKGFQDDQNIKVEKEPIMKKLVNHKLKTDTGIELSIPVEYFDSTDFLEFQKMENGTMNITLKNISNIINRLN